MGFPEMDLVRDYSKTTRLSRFLLYAIARHINNGEGSKYPGRTFVGRDKLMAAIGVGYTKDFYRLQKVLVDSGELVVEPNAGPGRAHLRSLALGPPGEPDIAAESGDVPAKLDLTDMLDFCEHTPFHTYRHEADCEFYDGKAASGISDTDKETLAGRPTKANTAAVRAQRKQTAKQEKRRRNRELMADHMSPEDGG